jgi:adenylate cyclase
LAGVVTADVEIPTPDCLIEIPDWAGPEITGDRRFSSGILAQAAAEQGRKLHDILAAAKNAA